MTIHHVISCCDILVFISLLHGLRIIEQFDLFSSYYCYYYFNNEHDNSCIFGVIWCQRYIQQMSVHGSKGIHIFIICVHK